MIIPHWSEILATIIYCSGPIFVNGEYAGTGFEYTDTVHDLYFNLEIDGRHFGYVDDAECYPWGVAVEAYPGETPHGTLSVQAYLARMDFESRDLGDN